MKKALFDFLPLILFFIAFKLQGLYVATAVAIAAAFIQVLVSWLQHRRVEKMHLLTLGLLVVFGGATLLLQDETFVKWKPSVLNWLFGLAFLVTGVIGRRTLAERLMGKVLDMPRSLWVKLNFSWALFFVALGGANLYVAYEFSTEIWVNFKVFGILALSVLFLIMQFMFLSRYIRDQEPETGN